MANKVPPEVQKLIDVYTKAQEQLVKIIKEKEAKGTMTAYQKSLLNQVMGQLNKLDNEAKNWTDETIPDSYNAGADAVDSYLKNNGLDTGFSQLNTGAIQALIDDCYGKLNDANNFIGRRIQDAVRQAGIDAVAQKLAQGQTVNQCKKNLIQSLLDEGITCIKDRRGRNINLSSYAEVVARSTTREATNTATLNQLQNYGYDLVKMSSHSPTCSICAIYQGRVYSISGKDSDYPPLDTAYSGDYANIHPNCAHVLEPYIPALADNPEGDMDFSNRPFELSDKDKSMIEQYNKQQAQKAQLRRDRQQYEKYKSILGDDVPNSFANFRQMKYNNTDKWDELKSNYRKIKAYNKIIQNEPAITLDLQDIAKATDTELVGLDYRLKSKESYLRKVNFDSNFSKDYNVIDDIINNTNDVIRYTYQQSYDKLADSYYQINKELSEKGYRQIKFKNTWLVKSNPYKGINCVYLSPNGQKFEIQFHTPESFELKNGEMHILYEKWRIIGDKSSAEAIELSKKMTELSSKLQYPIDIEKLR